ncbi:hypothetical protein V6N13_124773 [Hibiscus sabdariffa]
MDAPRGQRSLCPAQGRGRGRRANVIQDTPVITDLSLAPIGFQQVRGDAPPAQDPTVVDPLAHDPPVRDPPAYDPSVGGPPIGDPLVHVVMDLNKIDELMVGRVVWSASEVAPNLAELWLDHTDQVLDGLPDESKVEGLYSANEGSSIQLVGNDPT